MSTLEINKLTDLFVNILIWTSVTVVFVRGEVFTKPKDFLIRMIPSGEFEELIATLLYCAQCSGFWIGFLGSFIMWPFWISTDFWGIVPFLNGFCISLTSTIADRIIYGTDDRKD